MRWLNLLDKDRGSLCKSSGFNVKTMMKRSIIGA